MAVSCSALIAATLISALFEIYLLKRSMTENLTVLASAIAANSTAAIAFNDSASAVEILKALQADSDIQLGAIYLNDGALFALYRLLSPASAKPHFETHRQLPTKLPPDGHHFLFENNQLSLDLFHPIMIDGKRQGTLFIRSNLHKEINRLISFSVVMLLIMLIIAVVVYLMALRLQKVITEPLHHLARTAHTIADNKDYSIRVEKSNQDETGLFIDAFNKMLDVMQHHEADISNHRKLLESQVRKRTKELADERDKALAATQAKSQFLANMSHEIRTPMNAMIGMLSLLQDAPLPEKDRTYLETAISSSNTLLNVIDGILDFSKIEAGKLTLENIDFNLCQLIREVTALFINSAQQKQLALNCQIAANTHCQVHGDPTRLRQILYNLVSNAVKFTPAGQITLRVDVGHTSHQGQMLHFTVADTGIGIADKDVPALFQPFTQLDGSTTRKYGGTGLGLVVCKQLVELMGGKIGLESSLGKGTRFWFRLFLPTGPNCSATIPPMQQLSQRPSTKRLQGKILVVDDDPVNQTVASAMLETVGLQAETAMNGQQAVEMALKKPYDLILMDCQMPEMDGYQATKRIRQLQSSSRSVIIGITANAMAEDKRKCIASGMDDYLPKPIDLDTFTRLLEQWLTITGRDYPERTPCRCRTVHESGDPFTDTHRASLWDKQATLKNLNYDETILRKIIDVFLEQYPLQLAQITNAINKRDAKALQRSAHGLKGSIDHFWTREIHTLVLQLEKRGRSRDFSDIENLFHRLQRLMVRLAEQLRNY